MRLSRLAGTARALGFLAIWNGFYMAGAYLALSVLSGRSPSSLALGVAWLTGHGAYLLDRVKPSSRFDDPADRQADPTRAAFLKRHALALRIWVAAVALLAIVGAGYLRLWLIGPIVASYIGAFLYGSSPRPRPKDIPLLKNLVVGVAIAALAAALVWSDEAAALPLLFACCLLIPVVFVDAMICDLPDRESDREYGTITVALALGTRKVLIVSSGTLLLTMVAASFATPPMYRQAAWIFLVSMLLTTPWITRMRPRFIRDAIDSRLPLIAALTYLFVLGGLID